MKTQFDNAADLLKYLLKLKKTTNLSEVTLKVFYTNYDCYSGCTEEYIFPDTVELVNNELQISWTENE